MMEAPSVVKHIPYSPHIAVQEKRTKLVDLRIGLDPHVLFRL